MALSLVSVNALIRGVPCWYRILCYKCGPSVEELYQVAPFDVNIDYEGERGNILWYADPSRLNTIVPPLLRLGLLANHRDNCGRSFIDYFNHVYLDSEPHFDGEWAYLLIDYGCPPPAVNNAKYVSDAARGCQLKLRAYATRSAARKRSARSAACALLVAGRLRLGRDLAHILAALVWATRRNRECWQPAE